MRRRIVLVAAAISMAAGCGGGDGGGTTTEPPASGTITGTVTGRGGGIPDAQVALSGGGSQSTNQQGQFTFSGVAAGAKTLTLTPPTGFVLDDGQTAAKAATVTGGATTNVNWSLRLANTTPRTVEVSMGAFSFTSSDVTVPVGSTVRWVNATATPHTITPNNPSQPGAWPDQTVSGVGATFQHTFSTAGTYPYNCRLHAGMTGTVRVH